MRNCSCAITSILIITLITELDQHACVRSAGSRHGSLTKFEHFRDFYEFLYILTLTSNPSLKTYENLSIMILKFDINSSKRFKLWVKTLGKWKFQLSKII